MIAELGECQLLIARSQVRSLPGAPCWFLEQDTSSYAYNMYLLHHGLIPPQLIPSWEIVANTVNWEIFARVLNLPRK